MKKNEKCEICGTKLWSSPKDKKEVLVFNYSDFQIKIKATNTMYCEECDHWKLSISDLDKINIGLVRCMADNKWKK